MIRYNSGFMSVSETATLLGISRQAVRKAIAQNRLDAYLIGTQYAVKIKDAIDFGFDRYHKKYK